MLGGGAVVECGTHAELVSLRGHYWRASEGQMGTLLWTDIQGAMHVQ